MSRNKDLIWPGIMLIASLTNVVGATVAISRGDGNDSLAFKTGLVTSVVYATGHAFKLMQVKYESWAEKEAARRAITPLEAVTVQR